MDTSTLHSRIRPAVRWVIFALPSLAVFIAVGIPLFLRTIEVEYSLDGNLLVLVLGSAGLSMYAVFCILGWLPVAWLYPALDSKWITLAPLFIVWVCLLGQLFAFLNEGSFVAFTPLGLATSAYLALGVLAPRMVVRSIGPGALAKAY